LSHFASLSASLLSGFGSALHEPRVWFVFAISLIGGVVRGYSGFGGALIVIPLAAMAMGPTVAVPMFYLFDFGSATPYGYSALPKCKWTEILPMLGGHVAMLPLGTWMLVHLDPLAVRWGMDGVVVLMLIVLISGWRYTGRPTKPLSLGVGCTAGVMGAASGISGPPIIAYWLGRKDGAAAIRTNLMAYYALSSTATDLVFLWRGLFTWQTVIYAVIIWPAYAGGLWAGAKMFGRSTDRIYRLSAYVLIAIAAVLSAPVMDKLLK
jgi:uncharacterized protein